MMDLREDSRLEMVDTLFTRKDSYFASERDMDGSGNAGRRKPKLHIQCDSGRRLVHRGKSLPTWQAQVFFSMSLLSCPNRSITSSPAPYAVSSSLMTPPLPWDGAISRPLIPSMNSRYAAYLAIGSASSPQTQVLIPPGTAAMYEQLLKLETYELGKNPINWARILEIRHLKERMVRKGSKYAKASMTVSKTSSPFKSFILPDDFRVKEMERWFREQQKRASASAVRRSSSSGRQPSVATHLNHNHGQRQCPQCIPSTSGPPPVKWTASGAVPPKSEPLVVHATAQGNASTSSKSKLYSRAQALLSISRTIKPERVASLPVSNKHTPADPPLSRSSVVVSPPPLPVILRGQRSAFGLDDETGQAESALGDPELPESLSDDSPPPAPLKDVSADEIPRSAQSSPSGDDTSPNPNGVARRRSCIKRGSVSELGGKTVSWADDQELHNQMSRYTSVMRDAQASGAFKSQYRPRYLTLRLRSPMGRDQGYIP